MLKNKLSLLFAGETLQAKISRGVAWSFLGTMISKIFMLVVFIIIARMLTVEEYGEVGILRNAILTFSIIGLAGFGVTATRYIAKFKDTNKEKTSNILALTRLSSIIFGSLVSFLIFVFADQIAFHILNNTDLSSKLQYLSIAIFFTSINGYQNGALAGFEKFKEISFINIFNGFLSFPILLIGTYYWGVDGIVYSLVLVSILIWGFSFYFLEKTLKSENIKLYLNRYNNELNILYKFSLPTFLSGLMFTPTFFILNSILAHNENGYVQLGIFSAVFFFFTLSQSLIQILGQVLYPYAIKEFEKDNKSFVFINLILPWILGLIINLPLIVFPEIFSMLFGKSYMNESFYLSLIFIGFSNILTAFGQGIGRNFAAANLMWWSTLSNLIWSILSIYFAYILSSYGSVGISSAILIAYLINFILFIPFYIKHNLISRELLFNNFFIYIWLIIIIIILLPIYLESLIVIKIVFFFIVSYIIYTFVKLLFRQLTYKTGEDL